MIGADNWALEVIGYPVAESNLFPVHQELLAHYGVRIGESIVTDRLANDRIFDSSTSSPRSSRTEPPPATRRPCALGRPS